MTFELNNQQIDFLKDYLNYELENEHLSKFAQMTFAEIISKLEESEK